MPRTADVPDSAPDLEAGEGTVHALDFDPDPDPDPDLAIAGAIIRQHLPKDVARLWLYGSRARGDQRRWSDIDVAVEPLAPLPEGAMAQVREALAESRLLLDVDLIDLTAASEALRIAVVKDGLPWMT